MPFILLGLSILLTGVFLFRRAKRDGDEEGATGAMGLIIAGVLFMFVIGILYNFLFSST